MTTEQHGFFDPATQPAVQQHLPFEDAPVVPTEQAEAKPPAYRWWLEMIPKIGGIALTFGMMKLVVWAYFTFLSPAPKPAAWDDILDPEKSLSPSQVVTLEAQAAREVRLANLIKSCEFREAAGVARDIAKDIGLLDAKGMSQLNQEFPGRIKALQKNYEDLADCLEKKNVDGVVKAIERIDESDKWSRSVMPKKMQSFVQDKLDKASPPKRGD